MKLSSFPFLITLLATFLCVSLRADAADSAQNFFQSPYIVPLTPYTIHNFIASSHKPVFVLFYAPWCSHCQKFKEEYRKFGVLMGDTVRIGALDGDEHTKLAHEYNVKAFPTILYWPMGYKEKKPPPVEYQGPRTATSMQKLVLSDIKTDKVVHANSVEAVKELILQSDVKKAAVFFSSRLKPPPMMSVMSYSKQLSSLPFIFVNREVSEEVGEAFEITKIPSVAMIEYKGDTMTTSVFSDFRGNYKAIARFFLSFMDSSKNKNDEE